MTEWWTAQDGAWIGAIGGSALGVIGGCYGGLAGWLAPKGIGKTPMLTFHVGMVVLAAAGLVTGVAALVLGQPYHVWYPLTLAGGIGVAVMGSLLPVMVMRYRQAEQRKLGAEELRRG